MNRRAVCTASARGEKKNYNCHLSFVTRRLPPEPEQESALGKLPFCLR